MHLSRNVLRTSMSAIVLQSLVLLAACSSSTTSVVAPTADKCELNASSTPSSFQPTGGTGTITVSTSRDCTWSMATSATWVVLSSRDGQGAAAVPYSVSANPAAAPRTSTITVGAQQVQITQAAAECRFDLTRGADTIGPAGGPLTVGVSTLDGCRWTATSAAPWITIGSGQAGTGPGTVGVTVAPNSGAVRTGTASIAGQTYSITQGAAASTPAPDPNPPTSPAPSPPDSPTPTPPPASPEPPQPPAPPPPPPPGDGTQVQFDGTVLNVFGRCPNLTFWVDTFVVTTDASTDFRKMNCGDLDRGVDVSVDGTRRLNVVQADQVTRKKGS